MAYGGVTNKHGRGIHEWTIQCVAVSPSGKSRAASMSPKAAALTTSSLNLPVIEVSMPVPAFGGRVDGVRWARAASMVPRPSTSSRIRDGIESACRRRVNTPQTPRSWKADAAPRTVELTVALRHVRVAHGQKRAGDLDGVVHRRTNTNTLVVEVAAARHRRDRVDDVVRRRREAHAPDVHVDLRSRRVHAVAASMA
jgi:hypothetical protein